MKTIFKQLIADFQAQPLPQGTLRDLAPFELPAHVRKAFVLVGMRRSGKTWSLYQEMHRLLDAGVDRRQLLYLNFEDDRLIGATTKDLQSILDAYFELFPDLAESRQIYFFFDEIHEVVGWERFVRRLLDTEAIQIYLTGSSAKMLSKEIATSLRGRTLVREVFPYSFREYLRHLGRPFEVKGQPTTKQKAQWNHDVAQYLLRGGFPEVVEVNEPMRHEILQGYIDTVVYRDIIERYRISNVQVLRRFLSHCLQNPATLFSVNKTYHMLKSLGYSVSKDTLYAFMDYFQDAYCLFSVAAFDLSMKKSLLKPRKVYPVDSGLISAYAVHRDYQHGSALESMVFSALLRRCKEIHYFVTKTGLEVDFCIQLADESRQLFQVALSIADADTYKREFTALQQAMNELALDEGTIVTMDEELLIEVPEGSISVIPLWKFLLADVGPSTLS